MAIGASIGFPEKLAPHDHRLSARDSSETESVAGGWVRYGTTQGASHTFCDRVMKFGFAL